MEHNIEDIKAAVPELETIFNDMKQLDGVFTATESKLGRAEELMAQLEKQLTELKELIPADEQECKQKIDKANEKNAS